MTNTPENCGCYAAGSYYPLKAEYCTHAQQKAEIERLTKESTIQWADKQRLLDNAERAYDELKAENAKLVAEVERFRQARINDAVALCNHKDEIERLRAEVAELKDRCNGLVSGLNDAIEAKGPFLQIADLTRQLREAKEEVARLHQSNVEWRRIATFDVSDQQREDLLTQNAALVKELEQIKALMHSAVQLGVEKVISPLGIVHCIDIALGIIK